MNALRVLIIEDDAFIAELLTELLVGMGYEVCAIAATEAAAVRAATRCRPDLMIVDVYLGDGCGLSAVAEILRRAPVPTIFTSGDLSRVRAVRPEAVCLQKPYREADLGRVIQQALLAPAVAPDAHRGLPGLGSAPSD